MRTVYVMALILALFSLAFGIYMLARPDDEPTTGTSSTLFDAVSRAQIEQITLHHAGGKTFSVNRYTYEMTLGDGSKTELSGFQLMQGEKSYGNLTLEDEAFSELIVGAGTHYVLETVISAPEVNDENYGALLEKYEQKLKEYGFNENSPYYELEALDGTVRRVFYGSKTATNGTYYVRLEGRDTIYVSTSAFVGDLLYADEPIALVEASFIQPLTNQYAYAYVKRFAITDFVRYGEGYTKPDDENLTVKSSDRVGYTALDSKGNRVSMVTLYPLESYFTDEAYRTAFLGKSLGEQSFSFDVQIGTEEKDGEKVPVMQTVNIVSIDFVDRGDELLSVSFVNKSYRDLFHQFSIYEFLTPGLKNYLPDSTAFISALEAATQMTGSVVALEFSASTIAKYKLYSHMIELDVPMFGEKVYKVDAEGNETEDIDPIGYTSDMLYVSDVTENGTRYVGSLLFGIVAEVDAASLSFLDDEMTDWIEPSLLSASYEQVTGMVFDWNYSTENKWLSGAYDFKIYYRDEKQDDGSVLTVIDRILATGEDGTKTVTEAIFRQLYYRLLYAQYVGEHGLSDEELSSLLGDEENVALTLTMTLSDGTKHIYRFLPISPNRVLVALDSESDGQSAAFVVYGTVFKAVARAYVSVMENQPFDHEQRY